MADTPADTTPNADEQVRTFGDGFRLLEGELRTHPPAVRNALQFQPSVGPFSLL